MPDHDHAAPTAHTAVLSLPAETAYVAVLRMTTAGLAARLDFTLDDIEDLRMAVGEACALVLEEAAPDGELRAVFDLDEGSLRVHVSADATGPREPDTDTFGWQMLSALSTDLVLEDVAGRRGVAFTVKSTVSV